MFIVERNAQSWEGVIIWRKKNIERETPPRRDFRYNSHFHLKQQLLNLLLDGLNLGLDLRALILGDTETQSDNDDIGVVSGQALTWQQ